MPDLCSDALPNTCCAYCPAQWWLYPTSTGGLALRITNTGTDEVLVKTLSATVAIIAAISLLQLNSWFAELAGATLLVLLAGWITVILFRSRRRMVT